jgi:hypothetical protein
MIRLLRRLLQRRRKVCDVDSPVIVRATGSTTWTRTRDGAMVRDLTDEERRERPVSPSQPLRRRRWLDRQRQGRW